jgi:hypothetical protein
MYGLKAVPFKERTSGPKGHKDDNVYAVDKSPAYPKTDFFRSLYSSQARRPFTTRLKPCPSFDSLLPGHLRS